MKKLFSLMLLLATFAFILPSCKDDKDEPDTDIKKEMIGTWDATAVKFSDSDWVDITSRPSLALSITFKSDNTFSGRGALGNGSGTYTVSGKTIKTYVDGELYATYYVKEVRGNYSELTITMGNSSMDIKATKR